MSFINIKKVDFWPLMSPSRKLANYLLKALRGVKGDLHIIEKLKKGSIGFTYIAGKLWNMLPAQGNILRGYLFEFY